MRLLHSHPVTDILPAARLAECSTPYLAQARGTGRIRRLCIVIAGDRGLAGGYNANIRSSGGGRSRRIGARPSGYCVLPVGKKAVGICPERRDASESLTDASSAVAREVVGRRLPRRSSRLVWHRAFLAGEIDDEPHLAYTQFVSMLTQNSDHRCRSCLPLRRCPDSRSRSGRIRLILYEPGGAGGVRRHRARRLPARRPLRGACARVVAQSEQAARRTAMDAATKNAG